VVVLEAMKIQQPPKEHTLGTVTGLSVEVGKTVTNGAVDLRIEGLTQRIKNLSTYRSFRPDTRFQVDARARRTHPKAPVNVPCKDNGNQDDRLRNPMRDVAEVVGDTLRAQACGTVLMP
jgi:hypothetical protein